ncbi:SURF1 family protein [Pontibacterium sp.]|uniref:SURF1 family protein n=1 Tax=Pontibacterium sp. TaxID=2036026 RepID=UPI0035150C5F
MSKVQSMRRFKWMLLAMALLLWPVLVSLGFWQLDRAEQKSELLESWKSRAQQTQSLASSDLVRFSSVESQGEFDRERWLLLDNRTREGKVGYEVVALFYPQDMVIPVLVNLGWIQANPDRRIYPEIVLPEGTVAVSGRLTEPSELLVLAESSPQQGWPQRLQRLDISRLEQQLGLKLMPWVIRPSDPIIAHLDLSWTPTVMQPEKHQAYALQWFVMAAVLLGLIVWNLRKLRNGEVRV